MKYIYVCDKEMLLKEYFIYLGLSQRMIKQIRAQDNIYVNGIHKKNYEMIHVNDVLELEFSEKDVNANVSKKDIDIVYEDDYYLIVNKCANLASHPTKSHLDDNLLARVKYYFEKKNEDVIPRLVNRLDFSTSGLIIISKSRLAHYKISKINYEKKYLCLVKGNLEIDNEEKVIDTLIDRYPAPNIRRFVSVDSGQRAITIYKAVKNIDGNCLVECTLVTGRTHQIRVHMAYINHPIINDKLYNPDCFDLEDKLNYDTMYLHSYYISFIHPFTNEKIEVKKEPMWYN